MAAERTADDAIRSLSMALEDHLQWYYVIGKKPPYTVPRQIDHDLALMGTAPTQKAAYEMIRKAVEKAAQYDR
jgi:hypothetical protein